MPKTLMESRLFLNKKKIKIKPELNNAKSTLPANLQTIKQQLLSRNGFVEYN